MQVLGSKMPFEASISGGLGLVAEHIFISHSSTNNDVVQQLRQTLEDHGFELWVDSRESDTTGKAGGLMSRAASKAGAPPVVSGCESISHCAA